jgi:transcriptional regulator with XRE-family HTH domain
MSDDVRWTIGRNVRRLREAAGITQVELAEKARMDRSSISKFEVGRANPSVLTLSRIAKVLQTDVQQLFRPVPERELTRLRIRRRQKPIGR